ncbi:hypothetical protein DRQ17_06415, partial [bacterium]
IKKIDNTKKPLLLFILFFSSFPGILNGKAYRTIGWWDVSYLNISILHPSRMSVKGDVFRIGLSPPLGLGIEMDVGEFTGMFKLNGDNELMVTFAPIYAYFVPYIKWEYKPYHVLGGSPKDSIKIWEGQVVYLFCGFSNWAIDKQGGAGGKYRRCGIIFSKTFLLGPYSNIPLRIGIEMGYISFKYADWESFVSSFYVGITIDLSATGWAGFGLKKF